MQTSDKSSEFDLALVLRLRIGRFLSDDRLAQPTRPNRFDVVPHARLFDEGFLGHSG
jgi:hypothetical protein